MVFISAYKLLHPSNLLTIYGHNPWTWHMIYEPHSQKLSASRNQEPNNTNIAATELDISELSSLLKSSLLDLSVVPSSATSQHKDIKRGSMFSSALSGALCYINRMTSPQVSSLGDNGIDRNHTILRQKECRILAIQTSPDVSAQYISVMNCVFAAQKLNVCIDGCVLCIDEDSSFLQQACQLTRGIYCKPTIAQGYSHYFLSCFASDINSRRYIAIPLQKEVNYKVSCFCHHVAVNQGFVCSICLSVFCNAAEKCLVCGTDMSNKITIE